MPLDVETATFKKLLPHLLRHQHGKAVLIHGENLVGVFDTIEDACRHGAREFDSFLADEIRPTPREVVTI